MASPLQGLDICQSPLTQAPVKKVPVVRIFGATPAGKRARGAGGSGGRPGSSPRRALARTPPAPALSADRCRVFPPIRPPRLFLPSMTRGAKMWVRESVPPPPPPIQPQAGRRRAPSVYTAWGGREPGPHTRGRAGMRSGRRSRPGGRGQVAAPCLP